MMLAHCKMKYYVIQTSNNKKISRHQPVLDKGIDTNPKFAMAGKEMAGVNQSRIDDKISASGGTDEFGSEYSAGLDYYYYDDYQGLPSICEPASSAHKKFRCKKEYQCIDISKLCDGNIDCNDSTDEEFITPAKENKCSSAIKARIRDKSHGGGNFHLHYSGLLEVRFKGVWGTVCSSGITKKEADVFCHMLGIMFDTNLSGGRGLCGSTTRRRDMIAQEKRIPSLSVMGQSIGTMTLHVTIHRMSTLHVTKQGAKHKCDTKDKLDERQSL